MGGVLAGARKFVRGGYDDADISLRVEADPHNDKKMHVFGSCKSPMGGVDCDLTVQEIDGEIVTLWGNPEIADHKVNLECQRKAEQIARELYRREHK